jgi:protoporphyrinogen oxidase
MAERDPVVVLGAGVCGLYAARTLAARGVPVIVFEKEPVPGGLAAGFERNGNFFDLGVHLLHGHDRDILADVRSLAGGRLQPVELSALIRFGKGTRRYPLEFADLIAGIPPWRLAHALAGLAGQSIMNRFHRSEPENAEEALIRIYGRPLYEYFFRDFTAEYWGFPAAELSAGFVRTRMPRLSAVDAVRKSLRKIGFHLPEETAPGALSRETLWYSPQGSRSVPEALAGSILANGGEIRLSRPVTRIEVEEDRIRAVGFMEDGALRMQACSFCVSTIPLPDLVRAMTPAAPEKPLASADRLRYKPVVIFGLLLRKARATDALYIHYRDRIFHRIAEPANSGLAVRPVNHTVLLAEMTCEEGDDRWNGGEETKTRLLADLDEEGLAVPGQIAEIHHFRARHGYPVFIRGFESHRDTVFKYIGRIRNLRSVGRQGGFGYPNMHSAMREGADAAAAAEAAGAI